MSEHCFWILTDGAIVKPDSRHILAVVSCPVAFGESEQSLNETFKKYGQSSRSNVESKAREETLIRVIRRNHIRIRKNQHKRGQYWSIQLFAFNEERRSSISSWAKYVSPSADDKYGDVIIHQFKDRSKKRTSLDQLADGYDGAGMPEVVSQSELLERYE